MARLALTLLLLPAAAQAANCQQFFYQRQVAYVAPVVAYPQVYYQAGRDIEAEALAEKVARLVDKKLELRAQQRQQVTAAPPSTIAQHCAKCHSGATPKAGLVFDGVTALDARHVTAALKQIRDQTMPKDHKLPPGAAPALMEELLNLESEPLPHTVPRPDSGPPPAPVPDDGGLH